MPSNNTATQLVYRQTRPLCCRYLVVLFEVLPVLVMEEGAIRDHGARWALGVLPDGQYELLGMWLEQVPSAKGWEEVFDDLMLRGVEKIRFIASNERAEGRAGANAAYPGATVLPLIGQLLRQSLAEVVPRHRRSVGNALGVLREARSGQAARDALTALAAGPCGATYPSVVGRWRAAVEQLGPFYDLVPRLRRIILSGDDAIQQVHRSLCLAVGRHGCFADQTDVTSFVVGALERAERYLVGRATVREACIEHRAGSANRASSRSRVEALGL